MSDNKLKTVSIAVSSALAASMALSGVALADNPFAATDLESGYMVAGGHGDKDGEGKCGEGSCGEGDKDGEGSCGEGSCGEGDKDGEGSCGEGSCGGDKDGEGKCGEGSCGK